VNDTLPTVYGRKKNSLRQGDFVVFDIETTGLSARENAITEIGAVPLRGGQVVGEFSTFVNPGVHIPKYITELTGITDEMVREAPPPDEALRAFYDFCREDVLVAHNANFDCGFVRAAAERAGLRFDFTYIEHRSPLPVFISRAQTL
jgi:DNA polymerase-3 subunit alpha (Gram-positive type)